jgi:hypothetical protein
VTALAPSPVAGTVDGSPWAADPYQRATSLLAHLAVLVVGFDLVVGFGMPASVPVAILTLPLWALTLRRYALAPALVVLGLLAAATGWILSELTAADNSIDPVARIQSTGLLLSGLAALVLLLWAREWMPAHRMVALYGAGGLAGAVYGLDLSWKYSLSVPATFLALGLAERTGRRPLAVVVVLAMGVSGIVEEGRSFFAFCVMAALLTLWQARPAGRVGRLGRWAPAMMAAGMAVILYLLATALLTGGYLGTELQERSVTQIETTGSLLAGGRPEWAATRALFAQRPQGYGTGVVPSWGDYMAGKSGLASINIDAGGYTKNYIFGGQFRLHSVAADLWVSYGWVGLVLAATLLVALVRSLSFTLASRLATTSAIFAITLALWYLFFGPIYSNWLDVCVAVGLTLLLRDEPAGATQETGAPAGEPTAEPGAEPTS